MGILSELKEIVFGPPPGTVYTLYALEHHNREYLKHMRGAHDALEPTLHMKGYELLLKDTDGSVKPYKLLADIRFDHLRTIESWTDEEFIPKIRAFSTRMPSGVWPEAQTFTVGVTEPPLVNNLTVAQNHLDAARRHGKEVLEAIHFFLCDTRSPFQQRKALEADDGYPCTAMESCRWWTGGKRTVANHMRLAEEKVEKYLAFARSVGSTWQT